MALERGPKQDQVDQAFDVNPRQAKEWYDGINRYKDYQFGDISERHLAPDPKDVDHLRKVLAEDYLPPWRDILRSVIESALSKPNPSKIKFKFQKKGQRDQHRRIEVSYNKQQDRYTVDLKGPFRAPWDQPSFAARRAAAKKRQSEK